MKRVGITLMYAPQYRVTRKFRFVYTFFLKIAYSGTAIANLVVFWHVSRRSGVCRFVNWHGILIFCDALSAAHEFK